MDDVYLNDYTNIQAQRHAPHDTDGKGRIRCRRICSSVDESKIEAQACIKKMLGSRMFLVQRSLEAGRVDIRALSEPREKIETVVTRFINSVGVYRSLAATFEIDPEEKRLESLSYLACGLRQLATSLNNLGKDSQTIEADEAAVKLRRELVDQMFIVTPLISSNLLTVLASIHTSWASIGTLPTRTKKPLSYSDS